MHLPPFVRYICGSLSEIISAFTVICSAYKLSNVANRGCVYIVAIYMYKLASSLHRVPKLVKYVYHKPHMG